jgi:hypothetical protein
MRFHGKRKSATRVLLRKGPVLPASNLIVLLLILIGLGFVLMILLLALVINPPEALVKRFYRTDKKSGNPRAE